MSSGCFPQNVGIRAMELYFPNKYVDQAELEKYDGVSSGKYTIGFGLEQMGFCGVEEDVTSLCLTVVSALLKNYEIDRNSVGYLIVGSETLTDKSKGVFTALRRLFGDNEEIFGAECIGACYAGTSALFSAIDWIYANWNQEKRYAIVVMADIAVYAPGPARCTGGAGAFAALVGPDAAISFDKGLRAPVLRDAWDFYKPVAGLSSEYAHVDGPLSVSSYLSMLDTVYEQYISKASLRNKEVSLSSFEAVMMHCPYCKLVQKAFGRLAYYDYQRGFSDKLVEPEMLASLSNILRKDSYTDRQFNSSVIAAGKELWKEKTFANLSFNRRIGNMYTSSLYAQLFGLFCRVSSVKALNGIRILFFSYGSGAAAAMFSARINNGDSLEVMCQLEKMTESAKQAASRLESRQLITPSKYTATLLTREKFIHGEKFSDLTCDDGIPAEKIGHFPGTFILKTVDEKMRRFYELV